MSSCRRTSPVASAPIDRRACPHDRVRFAFEDPARGRGGSCHVTRGEIVLRRFVIGEPPGEPAVCGAAALIVERVDGRVSEEIVDERD